jgi:hypothetical protein
VNPNMSGVCDPAFPRRRECPQLASLAESLVTGTDDKTSLPSAAWRHEPTFPSLLQSRNSRLAGIEPPRASGKYIVQEGHDEPRTGALGIETWVVDRDRKSGAPRILDQTPQQHDEISRIDARAARRVDGWHDRLDANSP